MSTISQSTTVSTISSRPSFSASVPGPSLTLSTATSSTFAITGTRSTTPSVTTTRPPSSSSVSAPSRTTFPTSSAAISTSTRSRAATSSRRPTSTSFHTFAASPSSISLGPASESRKIPAGSIAAIALGVLVALLAVIFFVRRWRRAQRQCKEESEGIEDDKKITPYLQQESAVLSYRKSSGRAEQDNRSSKHRYLPGSPNSEHKTLPTYSDIYSPQ
ncbi:unnamed protein product [Cyclocybe aegerita]|uniref:Uncharacterized protein n=1 Tax=Cyclocybe aegerita TaxID=1973307 RepID=A0A8S0XVV1_CYCAE|nr:unnamed protein product [Cyclocybe aegerita]